MISRDKFKKKYWKQRCQEILILGLEPQCFGLNFNHYSTCLKLTELLQVYADINFKAVNSAAKVNFKSYLV